MSRRFKSPFTARAIVALIVLALPLGCGSDGDGGPTGPELTLVVSPGSLSLFVGETGTIAAAVPEDASAQITFTSSESTVATVDPAGTVTAVGIGSATITVSVAGTNLSETVAVTVNPSTISVTPMSVSLVAGESLQLTATVTGGVGLTVSWASSASGVATVDATGLVTAVASGSAQITASVDGQPSVQASATITVVAPPTVTSSSITDASGAEADLSSVTDSLVFTFELEGEEGSTGTIEVLVDDAVVASTDFTVPTGVAEGGPQLARRALQVNVPVDVLQVENIAEAGSFDFREVIQSGTGIVTAQFGGDGSSGGQTILLRGQPSLTATFDQAPVVLVTDYQPQGPTAPGPDSVVATRSPTTVAGQILFDGGRITRVEVITPGATATYGSDAIDGVVEFTFDPADYGEYEGPIAIENFRAFDATNQPVDTILGFDDPRYAGIVPNPYWFDALGPVPLNGFEVDGDVAVGLSFEREDFLEGTVGFGGFTDATTVTTQLDARAVFGAWAFEDLRFGEDLVANQLDGRSVDVSILATDALLNTTRLPLTLTGSSSFAKMNVDLQGIVIEPSDDPIAIRDGQLGLNEGSAYLWRGIDADGLYGNYKSGEDFESTWGRLSISNVLTDRSYLLGGPDTWEGVGADPFTTGYRYEFAESGEIEATFRAFDHVGNSTDVTIQAALSLEDPVVEPFTIDGPLSLGGPVEFNGITAEGFPELKKMGAGIGYPGVMPGGERLILAPTPFTLIDEEFNGTFTPSATANFVIESFTGAISTAGEFFPQPISNEPIAADVAVAGALTTGFTIGVSYYDISGSNPFSEVDWGDIDATGLYGEGELCIPAGGTCPPGSTTETYLFDNFIPGSAASGGPIAMTEAQLYVISRLDANTVLARPISERIEVAPNVRDFGSYRQWTIEFEVDTEMQEFSHLDEYLAAFGFDEDDNAVMTWPLQLSLRFAF